MNLNPNLELTPLLKQRYEIMRLVATGVVDEGIILKGGTGLLLCYGLDRFSDDMDFDPYSEKFNFERFQRTLEKILRDNGVPIERLNIKKDTNTTKRLMVKYTQVDTSYGDYPLKIEFSLRNTDKISDYDYHIVNGICVYKIEKLAMRKLDAFNHRTKNRDIYDMAFLVKNFPYVFNKEMLQIVKSKDPESLLVEFETNKCDLVLSKVDGTKLILDMIDNIKKIEQGF
ncbi:MAG: nucleotidyl transferase AbiEii/AbiGii toxin family protein [Christensenellaceae bacterium]|nr:nucleotidyl transferase AbiEii/AbiGii toxin family protein [Christensenellaceae bacterium]